jgi:hypothetical protein
VSTSVVRVLKLSDTDSKYDFNAPDLPNGLKDIPLASASSSSVPTAQCGCRGYLSREQRLTQCVVMNLLNPCTCKDVWSCTCLRADAAIPPIATSPVDLHKGFAVLAHAAALLEASSSTKPPPHPSRTPAPHVAEKKRLREGSQSPRPRSQEPKRAKPTPAALPTPTPPVAKKSCCSSKAAPPSASELAHAALLDMPVPVALPLATAPFSLMPAVPTVPTPAAASDACCCGFQCMCPGCVEHRGPAHATGGHADCASGACSTCVDHRKGIALALPGAEASDLGSFVSSDRLDALFSAVRTSAARISQSEDAPEALPLATQGRSSSLRL